MIMLDLILITTKLIFVLLKQFIPFFLKKKKKFNLHNFGERGWGGGLIKSKSTNEGMFVQKSFKRRKINL